MLTQKYQYVYENIKMFICDAFPLLRIIVYKALENSVSIPAQSERNRYITYLLCILK